MKHTTILPVLRMLLLSIVVSLISLNSHSQTMDDFEAGSLNGWYSEGDGSYSLSTSLGNPGNSLKVDDDATGSINYAIAPNDYLGDWSAAGNTDSLSADLYIESSDPDPLTSPFPVFTLSGPGGSASILAGYDQPHGAWQNVSVSLDPADWTMEYGTWSALMDDVQLLKIRAEYVQGNENIYIDNIELSFSPYRPPISDTICSDFEDGTLDGWRFEGVNGIETDSLANSSLYALRIGDGLGEIGLAFAPSKFWGDWSNLQSDSEIQFDLKIDNSSGSLINKAYLVQLSGNNAVAEILPPNSELNMAVGQWHTFSLPLDSTLWSINTGYWSELMTAVSDIAIELEFINGSEEALLDNFCLMPSINMPTVLEEPNKQAGIELYPNPAQDFINIQSLQNKHIDQVEIHDLTGKSVYAINGTENTKHKVDISNLKKGVYFIGITLSDQSYYSDKVIIYR